MCTQTAQFADSRIRLPRPTRETRVWPIMSVPIIFAHIVEQLDEIIQVVGLTAEEIAVVIKFP